MLPRAMRSRLAALALWAAAMLLAAARPASALPDGLPSGYATEDIARNLGLTTDFLFLPDERCLVLLKSGRILMLKGKKITGIVADLSDRLGSHVGDRGLMTVEHHPKFPEVPYLYIGYVYDGTKDEIDSIFAPLAADSPNNDPYYAIGPKLDRLSRFTMVEDVVDPASEVILIGNCTKRQGIWWGDDCSPMPGITHSIDWVKFGPDGALWVAIGDGQTFEGTDWTSTVGSDWLGPMDIDYLPGKILRVDENGNGLPDNPFYSGDPTQARSRVWALGIRQPWRCDFVPGSNPPDLLCGIVGWYTWETLSLIQKGANLGWPCWEGPEKPPFFIVNGTSNWDAAVCQKFYRGDKNLTRIEKPSELPDFNASYHVYGWNHNGQSSSIIGGVFSPRSMAKEFGDSIFIADFVSSRIDAVPWDFATNRPKLYRFNATIPWTRVPIKNLGSNFDQPVTLKVGPDGNLWVLGHCVKCSAYGILRRVIPSGGNTTLPYGNATVSVSNGDENSGGLVILSGDACYPKDKPRIHIADLPNGWDSIMYVSQFPNVRYARNGNHGPIEIDASVGKDGSLDGSLMSVGGVTYRNGLGTFGTSEVHLPILGYCYSFTAEVGVDDEVLKNAPAGTLTFDNKGFGEFIVKADGQVVHNHSAFTGTYAKTGVVATKLEVKDLHLASDLGLYAWKPYGNSMPMADTSANHYDWAEARIYCGPDAPYLPSVDISYPEPKNSYALGEDVVFSGTVTAFDGSTLPEASYNWYVNLVHCQGALCHMHFLDNYSGVKNGVFKVQPHPLDNDKQFIYYQLKLVATDLCGRSAYQVRNILISSDSASDAAAQRQTSRRERRRKMEVRLSQLSPEESYRMLMRYRRMGRRSETGPEHAPAANFHQ